MYKLLHIHTDIKFIEDSLKFIDKRFNNEIVFLGVSDNNTVDKFRNLGIPFKIFDNSQENIKSIIVLANRFDAVIFYCLEDIKIQILLGLQSKIKTFTRFFGFELYNLCMNKYLSDETLNLLPSKKQTVIGYIKSKISILKRSSNILLNKEYSLKFDNQKRVYKKLDAILMINKFEYDELRELFYLPKLIELQFTNHENETHEFKTTDYKSNKIIVGNNGSETNNHIDVLNVFKNSKIKDNIELNLFFSYANTRTYSYKIKEIVSKIKNVNLIEKFLSKEEFEYIYESSAALVIGSYRQNALGNIFTAIKFGCKIYLSKRSSTYRWLISKGFIISEVDDLKHDLESGNIKLSIIDQKKNIDLFLSGIKEYSVNDFLTNIIAVLEE